MTSRRSRRRDGFPREVYRAPRSWAEQSFHKLIYWNKSIRAGHLAAWDEKRILFDFNTRPFDGAKILVGGGGDSAAEYAQMQSVKNEVTLSYRQASFTRLNSINEKNHA